MPEISEENIQCFLHMLVKEPGFMRHQRKTGKTKAAALLHRPHCHHWSSPQKGKPQEESSNTTTTQSGNNAL